MKQNIVIKQGVGEIHVDISVTVYLFKEGDLIVSFCPSLDLAGSGIDEESAKNSFEVVMEEYLSYCIEHKTLHEDLKKHGWKENAVALQEPSFESLYKTNRELRKIVGKPNPDYRCVSVNTPVTAFA